MKALFLSALLLWTIAVVAQHHQDSHQDTTSIASKLRRGTLHIHTRSFTMATHNLNDRPSYFALAKGLGAAWESPHILGFYARFSGFFIFDVASSDFTESDPKTGISNRYELPLFDMNDPTNREDLDRFEELLLGYQHKDWHIRFGRQVVNTPFLNEQDNRMRPNLVNGISTWYDHNTWHGFLGWYTAVTPRGTVDWYHMGDSYGVYPFGRNRFGEPSAFVGNTSTKGLGVAGLKRETKQQLFQFWTFWAENVFLLHKAQWDADFATSERFNYIFGVQGFAQTRSGDGGNAEELLSYYAADNVALAAGARAGLQTGRHEFTLNYMRVADKGALLFPREWGREQFFVSMPRERIEGAGDVHAANLLYTLHHEETESQLQLGAGIYQLPGVNNFALNKYGLPSFAHFYSRYHHQFHGLLEGLDIDVLAVYKANMEEGNPPPENRINRVDMINVAVVFNYNF
ncbi:MAG: hypothetical protein LAT76_06500 [Schleiferiaceae bacterium]|nr:hypothetical protein [Schleiferiaceae bacterium]